MPSRPDRLSLRVSVVDLLSVLFPLPAMVAIGGLFFGFTVVVSSAGQPQKLLSGLVMMLIGALAAATLYGLMNKQVVFDRTSNRVTISRFWLPICTFPLSEVARLEYAESNEDGDGPVGQTNFVMRDGRKIPYNRTFSSNLVALRNLVEQGNDFLGIPKPPPKPRPQGPDFAKFKQIIREGMEEAKRQADQKHGE